MGDDLSTRCTTALLALEGSGVIRSAWLPGQQVIACVEGDDGLYILDGDAGGLYKESWILVHQSRIYDDTDDVQNIRHNLAHPVTAASLIVLVREAWGREGMHACRRGRGIWCVSHDPWMHARKVSQGSTEAEALVAALEARVAEIPS